jgi:hypothetical protein
VKRERRHGTANMEDGGKQCWWQEREINGFPHRTLKSNVALTKPGMKLNEMYFEYNFGYFSDRVLWFYLGSVLDHDPLTPCLPHIWDCSMYHDYLSFLLRWDLANIFPKIGLEPQSSLFLPLE